MKERIKHSISNTVHTVKLWALMWWLKWPEGKDEELSLEFSKFQKTILNESWLCMHDCKTKDMNSIKYEENITVRKRNEKGTIYEYEHSRTYKFIKIYNASKF